MCFSAELLFQKVDVLTNLSNRVSFGASTFRLGFLSLSRRKDIHQTDVQTEILNVLSSVFMCTTRCMTDIFTSFSFFVPYSESFM